MSIANPGDHWRRNVIIINFGSNLGDRSSNISRAIRMAFRFGAVLGVSRAYFTPPVSRNDDPEYMNVAAAIKTDMTPGEVLLGIKKIERAVGRPVVYERWSSRIIDVDIITWAGYMVRSRICNLPHSEYKVRNFVVLPMFDLSVRINRVGDISRFGPMDSKIRVHNGMWHVLRDVICKI